MKAESAARPFDLPDGRIWLRVADPAWEDPLDSAWAERHGGRWNPPGSFPTLYLNADVETARMQIEALLRGSPVTLDDLDDASFGLVAAALPRSQTVADAVSDEGLEATGLPRTCPLQPDGTAVPHATCHSIGMLVKSGALRGVLCRSAARPDGSGTELAWFPATKASKARAIWPSALLFGEWRSATDWDDLGLDPQPPLSP